LSQLTWNPDQYLIFLDRKRSDLGVLEIRPEQPCRALTRFRQLRTFDVLLTDNFQKWGCGYFSSIRKWPPLRKRCDRTGLPNVRWCPACIEEVNDPSSYSLRPKCPGAEGTREPTEPISSGEDRGSNSLPFSSAAEPSTLHSHEAPSVDEQPQPKRSKITPTFFEPAPKPVHKNTCVNFAACVNSEIVGPIERVQLTVESEATNRMLCRRRVRLSLPVSLLARLKW
jgi:hypothetical protein